MSIIKKLRWKDKSGKTTDYDLGAKASNVEQDSTHRFVSDTEKQTWNGKANPGDIPSGSAANYGVANNDTTNRSDQLVTAQVAYQHGKEIDQLISDMRVKTVQKVHGGATSGNVAINISFSTDNGCVTLLVSAGQFLLFISIELDLVTSVLSANGVEYYSPYSGGKEIKSVAATSAIPGFYRVKITTDANITAFDVVAISGEIDNLQVGSAAG